MKTHKNIDRLFQEKLKDFEVSPPQNIWSNIEKEIHPSDKKPLLLWLKIGSVAVVFLLLTITGLNYFKTPSNVNEVDTIVIDEEKTNIPTTNNSSEENPKNSEQKINSEEKIIVNTKFNEKRNKENKSSAPVISKDLKIAETNKSNKITSLKIKLNNKDEFADFQKNLIEKGTQKVSNEASKDSKLTSTTESSNVNTKKETQALENVLKKEVFEESTDDIAGDLDNKTTDEVEDLLKNDEDEGISKKWSVATTIGSISLNSFNEESSLIDQSLISNENQIANSLSYGVKVGYQLNKKLSLQSGINIINVNSQTNNVLINSNLNPTHLSAIDSQVEISSTDINSQQNSIPSFAKKEILVHSKIEGTLNQEFGYIEVPLEMKYNLSNGKVGLNLVGGFSTLILNKNSIHFETNELSTKIGEANNLNDINFSGNFGVDVDYKINKQLFFNLSPMIKIQTNTFSSNSGNFKPYVIGVYTGLNYKF